MNNKYFAVLPLNLVYEEKYSELSSKAILLYSLFLNRTKFSLQNKKFIDDNGVFIYYSTEQISKHLHCGISSAKVTLSELEQAGLIRKEYQQNGLPLKIYVNDIRAENNGAYSAFQKPQDKFSNKPYLNSDYKEKPHTDYFEGNGWQGNTEGDKPLTQAQINRRTFGDKKNKRYSHNGSLNYATKEKQVSFDVELEEELAKSRLEDFSVKKQKRRTRNTGPTL